MPFSGQYLIQEKKFRKRHPSSHLLAIEGGFRSVGDVEKQKVVNYVNRQNPTFGKFI
ncbi:MAG: hypothetical protein QW286_02855 [Candidatus Aenigmatarchaeota archaeon]